MQNKPKRRWLDVQIVLASLAITGTLTLWNVISGGSRQAGSAGTPSGATPRPTDTPQATASPTPQPTATTSPTGLTVVHLPPLHMLLGGKAPVIQKVVVSSGNGAASGSGGGSGSNPPPPPVTTTGSSHP